MTWQQGRFTNGSPAFCENYAHGATIKWFLPISWHCLLTYIIVIPLLFSDFLAKCLGMTRCIFWYFYIFIQSCILCSFSLSVEDIPFLYLFTFQGKSSHYFWKEGFCSLFHCASVTFHFVVTLCAHNMNSYFFISFFRSVLPVNMLVIIFFFSVFEDFKELKKNVIFFCEVFFFKTYIKKTALKSKK